MSRARRDAGLYPSMFAATWKGKKKRISTLHREATRPRREKGQKR